jgi:hypothetical protein
VEVFDGASWTELLTILPRDRYGFAAVCLQDKLVMLGGDEVEVDVYDPVTKEWSELPQMITPQRMGLTAISF